MKYFQIIVKTLDIDEVDDFDELIDSEYTVTDVMKIQSNNIELVLKEIREHLESFQ
jgi:hypothetical protein